MRTVHVGSGESSGFNRSGNILRPETIDAIFVEEVKVSLLAKSKDSAEFVS
jgi:hypothetical protein